MATSPNISIPAAGGTITFTVQSEPSPAIIEIERRQGSNFFIISGNKVTVPENTAQERTGDFDVTATTPIDPSYPGTKSVSSAYTIYQEGRSSSGGTGTTKNFSITYSIYMNADYGGNECGGFYTLSDPHGNTNAQYNGTVNIRRDYSLNPGQSLTFTFTASPSCTIHHCDLLYFGETRENTPQTSISHSITYDEAVADGSYTAIIDLFF